MRNLSLRLLCCLTLLVCTHLAYPSGARGQQAYYPPYEWYVFHMASSDSNTNGYFHTPWWSQGANAGWTYKFTLAGIYPEPGNGYTPAPESQLIPLHQWTVFQGVRSYIYYSTTYSSHGSGYTYNNVAGYVYPTNVLVDINGRETVPVGQYYSQERGFYYTAGEPGQPPYYTLPPTTGYQFQGIVFRIPSMPTMATRPNGCNVILGGINCNSGLNRMPYNPPPPPPPPSCDSWQEQDCYNSGGYWDSNSCTCSYY